MPVLLGNVQSATVIDIRNREYNRPVVISNTGSPSSQIKNPLFTTKLKNLDNNYTKIAHIKNDTIRLEIKQELICKERVEITQETWSVVELE